MSISELEDTFIEDLNQLDDWILQYDYLIEISADMPHVSAEERTDERRVHGCQSGVWVVTSFSGGRVRIRADSDALIIRGIISIIVTLLNGRTPGEIVAYRPRFISSTNIMKQISTDRFNGINSVLSLIQHFASQFV